MEILLFVPLLVTCSVIFLNFTIYRISRHPFHFWSLMLEVALAPVMLGLGGWVYFAHPQWAGIIVCIGGLAVAIIYYLSMNSLRQALSVPSAPRTEGPQIEDPVVSAHLIFINSLLGESSKLMDRSAVRDIVSKLIEKTGLGGDWKVSEEATLVPLTPQPDRSASLSLFTEVGLTATRMIKSMTSQKKACEVVCGSVREAMRQMPGSFSVSWIDGLSSEVELPLWLRLLRPGKSYLLMVEKMESAFEILKEIVATKVPTVCVTLSYPEHLREEYSIEGVPVLWLSKHGESAVPPDALDILRDRVLSLAKSSGGVVFLEGIELLIKINGFDSTLQFVRDIVEAAAVRRFTLMAPINPITIDKTHLSLLQLMMESIPLDAK
jgi:hypothetical protein